MSSSWAAAIRLSFIVLISSAAFYSSLACCWALVRPLGQSKKSLYKLGRSPWLFYKELPSIGFISIIFSKSDIFKGSSRVRSTNFFIQLVCRLYLASAALCNYLLSFSAGSSFDSSSWPFFYASEGTGTTFSPLRFYSSLSYKADVLIPKTVTGVLPTVKWEVLRTFLSLAILLILINAY